MSIGIDRVAVVGCGLIGTGWASWFLSQGLTVTCSDPQPGTENRMRAEIAANLTALGRRPDHPELMSRLCFEPDLARAVAGSQWVQENVPEQLHIKQEVLRQIDQAAPVETVIASSTSSIKVSDLQASLSHPERIVAGHPFLPVTLIPLVEVAGGALTSAAVLDFAMAFYRCIGKQPIRLRREITGHVANRLQAALMREAFFLLQEGVASGSDIDLAVTHGPGLRWPATGPLMSHHLAGGPDGARGAFANLGQALEDMWADLGTPTLTPTLEGLVVAATEESVAAKPAARWAEERLIIARAIQSARTCLEGEQTQ